MTVFWREGFFRTTAGGVSWVEGHWVDRDDWDRSGGSGFDYREHACPSLTSRSIGPNSSCPVCGAPVFFYQNENGSRVYFDELGPPWPKHPCTDNVEYSPLIDRAGSFVSIEPHTLYGDETFNTETYNSGYTAQLELLFELSYGCKPWVVAKVLKKIYGAAGVFIVLQKLCGSNGKKVFIHRKSIPRCLKAGSIVMMYKSNISFFDIATMSHIEIQVRRIKSASAFIDDVTTVSQDSPE